MNIFFEQCSKSANKYWRLIALRFYVLIYFAVDDNYHFYVLHYSS